MNRDPEDKLLDFWIVVLGLICAGLLVVFVLSV